MALRIVILAAGQGKRMASALPKVLHPLAGKPLLHHVIATAERLQPEQIFVVAGHQYDLIQTQSKNLNVTWLRQEELLGTADALAQAMPHLQEDDRVLVLFGDVPLVATETLLKLLESTPTNGLGLVLAEFANPHGLGRVVRDAHHGIVRIVEEKDATPEQKAITEIFAGLLTVAVEDLKRWLPAINNRNAQGEYYLTDIISMAVSEGKSVIGVHASPFYQVQGVNDRSQLAFLERCYQQQQVLHLMQQGVSMTDPHRVDIRGEARIGQDVFLDANVILEGSVEIGAHCVIDSNVVLRNVKLADNVHVKPFSLLEDCIVAEECIIGPYARLRPGTELARDVHIGNFVELKQAKVADRTKINHHSYIGDSIIGQDVNIGAGTITCNYDGANKHQTQIGDNVFVGANTNLVAPINIGENATIGAGTTVRKNVASDTLTMNPVDEKKIEGWKRPKKLRKE